MIKYHFSQIFPFIIRDRWLNYSSVILVLCDWTTSVLVSSLTVSHDFTNDICFTGWLGIWNSKAKEKLERKKKKQPDTTLKPWMCSVELRFGNVKKKMSGSFSYCTARLYCSAKKSLLLPHAFHFRARSRLCFHHALYKYMWFLNHRKLVKWYSVTFFFSLHCLSLQYIYKYIYTRSFLQLKSIIHMTFLTIKV